jgi:hypothetical protein
LKETPEVIKDIKLFKILLTPLELFTLKYILNNLRPLNVREVYSHSLFCLFLFVFADNDSTEKTTTTYQFYIQQLVSAGYGNTLVDKSQKKKIISEVFPVRKAISITECEKLYYKNLREHKSRIPSYEKFKGIFQRFEKMGILYRRAKEGKIILYGLNPLFYNNFKDKIQEINRLYYSKEKTIKLKSKLLGFNLAKECVLEDVKKMINKELEAGVIVEKAVLNKLKQKIEELRK